MAFQEYPKVIHVSGGTFTVNSAEEEAKYQKPTKTPQVEIDAAKPPEEVAAEAEAEVAEIVAENQAKAAKAAEKATEKAAKKK